MLVGPEGGLEADEVGLLREKGFVPVSLGPRTLRAETAAVAALAVLQHRWGDLR
jgi:16S rRNA (uracil1498-N3)-methyltransferase